MAALTVLDKKLAEVLGLAPARMAVAGWRSFAARFSAAPDQGWSRQGARTP
jgi:hypothetical protein